MSEPPDAAGPTLRIVRGNPSPEELAALAAVVAVRASGSTADAPPPAPSAWADRRAGLRRPLGLGRGAWRASGLPHPH